MALSIRSQARDSTIVTTTATIIRAMVANKATDRNLATGSSRGMDNKAMGSSRVMDSNKAMGRTRGTDSNKAMDRNLAMDNKGTDRNLVMGSSKATGSNLAMASSSRAMASSSKDTGRNPTMVSLKATDSPMATSIRTSINTSILRAAPLPAAATSTRRPLRPHTHQATLAGETSIRWAAIWKYNPAVHSFRHSIQEKLLRCPALPTARDFSIADLKR